LPGVYTVECRGVQYAGDLRIAGVRAFPAGAKVTRGEKIKEIPVDLGGIAVVDIATLEPSTKEVEEEYMDWLEDVLYGSNGESQTATQVWEPTGTKIPVVASGFGDGSYPVYQLVRNGTVVGLEAEFIAAGSPFPFETE
jgi:hypothetical protein